MSATKRLISSEDILPLWMGVEKSISGKSWHHRAHNPRDVEMMCQRFDLDPALAECLSSRGITPKEVESFLAPSLKQTLPDPLVLADMDKALQRLQKAIEGHETIGIFGDYDVDGTTSASLLSRYFRSLEVPHHVHLPDRFTEGYGPNTTALRDLQDKGASLVLTVDCGAMAHEVLERAAADGLDVIVLDHHQMSLPLPPASAVINPNRPDDTSKLGGLSAAGVTFMTLVGLNRSLRQSGYFSTKNEPNLLAWLDIVSLGLVCDVMPLTGVTRVLVAQGLKIMGELGDSAIMPGRDYIGLQKLAALAGAKGQASTYHLGFVLGPRINAAGRIGHANLAYRLMTETNPGKAEQLALQLHQLNAERQGVEEGVLQQALELAPQQGAVDTVAIAAADHWHIGVIGIVAGRLKERLSVPALVISFEEGIGKGSGRSIPGIDLGAIIHEAVNKGLLIGGGGHAMACGLTIAEDKLPAFREFMQLSLVTAVKEAHEHTQLLLDGEVSAAGVTRHFWDGLEKAGPFGAGHPEPIFVLKDMQIVSPMVRGEKHVACTLIDRTGRRVRAIAFRVVGEPVGDALLGSPTQRYHISGKIKPDEWRGGDAAQLIIEDLAAV